MKTFNTYLDVKNINNFNEFIKSNNIEDNENTLVLVFDGVVEIENMKKIQKILKSNFKKATIIGTTSDGEILEDKISTNKIVVSIINFENITIKKSIKEYNKSWNRLGKDIKKDILTTDTKLIITFLDGIYSNANEYLRGLKQKDVIISGALATDNGKLEKSYVFDENNIYDKGAVAISLNGEFFVHTEYTFNWQPISKKYTVTKSLGNVVYEIDNIPVNKFYEKYIGKDKLAYMQFPLLIKRKNLLIARNVTHINEDGSFIFSGEIHENEKVQFGYSNDDLVLNDIKKIPQKIVKNPVESIFIFSSMARRKIMPHLINSEIKPYASIAESSGFFGNGEIFTLDDKVYLFHNTMTILSISEDDKIIDKDIKYDDKKFDLSSRKILLSLTKEANDELEEINNELEIRVKKEIAKQRKKEQLLIQQSKLASMGEMIGNIAHQWRQPLNALSIVIQHINMMYKRGKLTPEVLDKKVNDAMKLIEKMSNTIDDFRNFFYPNKEKEVFSLCESVNESLSLIKETLKIKNIEINLESSVKNDYIYGYKSEFSQVILNIIKNAQDIFHIRNIEDKKIFIRCYEEFDLLVLEIEDTAGGIDENIMEKIFEPYFTTKFKSGGTGIGLYMSKTIIEQNMDGELIVENGKYGAKFIIKMKKYKG